MLPSDDIKAIHRKVESARGSAIRRDADINLVRAVRAGRMHELFPMFFADEMPRSMVANTIDNAARDTAELIAPLPSLACASGNMTSQADNVRAGKKNKIGSYYWDKSRLERQNLDFADAVLSYGFGVYIVEPDFEHMCPRVRWESSFGSYYYKDRFGQLRWYAKVAQSDVFTVCEMYPEKAAYIKFDRFGQERGPNTPLDVITYIDDKEHVVYLPDCAHLVLARIENRLGRVPVAIAERPDQEATPRGQYDDAVYPQLARAIITMYSLKAAEIAVNAPIQLPNDVNEFSYGPDSTIRTDGEVKRVRLDLPDDTFAVAEQLNREVKEGSRYPEVRGGGVSGNIITGKGVEALAGTLVTQVKTMQTVIGAALELATSLCFEMDVAFWGNTRKSITGVLTGKAYELAYTPAKDIGDLYGCKVTYGFASGQTPSQAIVALLQLMGPGLVSADTVRRQLPFDIDPEEEQRAVDVASMEEAAKQGLLGLSQAFGPMVLQGQDPLPVLQSIAKAIDLRRKGKSVSDSLLEAFQPSEQPEAPELPPDAPEGAMEPGMGPEGELPPGVRGNGLTEGVPYGQAGAPPGGMPSVQGLLSSLRGNGSAVMESSISRKRAIGA